MAKRIALNRVAGESDIGHLRDVAGIAKIEAAVKDPRRIKSMTPSGCSCSIMPQQFVAQPPIEALVQAKLGSAKT
jgi:hypothetical protein